MTTTAPVEARKKIRVGFVISDKMDKTRVIAIHWTQQHPVYHRHVRRISKFKAHDEKNETHTGDQVRIIETRPLSKEKRWRIIEVLEKAEQVDVRPEDVGQSIVEELESRPEATKAASAAAAEAPPAPAPKKAPVVAKKAEPVTAEAPAKKPRVTRKKIEPAAEAATPAKVELEAAKPARKPRAKKADGEAKK